MEFDITFLSILLLAVTGLVAGFINTIAGGGSMLTLPALMILGIPADIANGTNRVAIFLQSIAGARGFHKEGKLATSTIIPTMIPALLGSLLGAQLTTWLPEEWLKEALLGTMIAMALLMLVRPGVVAPPEGTTPYTFKQRPLAWFALFFAGLYGGFIQAGVGFLLIAAVAGSLRFDLARTNALKVVITAGLTVVALVVFIIHDQVMWIPGLIMGAGSIVGASMSVKFAISVPQATLKWVLFALVLLACGLAWFDPFSSITG